MTYIPIYIKNSVNRFHQDEWQQLSDICPEQCTSEGQKAKNFQNNCDWRQQCWQDMLNIQVIFTYCDCPGEDCEGE